MEIAKRLGFDLGQGYGIGKKEARGQAFHHIEGQESVPFLVEIGSGGSPVG